MNIDDPVFGKMEYDYEWVRPISVVLWGNAYEVSLTVQSLTNEDKSISKVQQNAYLEYSQIMDIHASTVMSLLLDYCSSVLEVPPLSSEQFLAKSKPTTIFFALDGSWGILFDSAFDEENGIAAKFYDGKWEIGPQDILI